MGRMRSALEMSFEEHIRPLLDAVDRLRSLGIMEEGIELPTIVVVGDQSSGKSSLLESLARIPLPIGQGISTRVPLILRLQSTAPSAVKVKEEKKDEQDENGIITISYNNVKMQIAEADIHACIEKATNELAGAGKAIANKAITLHVKKKECPDLTMVDLPGITRVPVLGQPSNIYTLITEMIRYYIKPQETIIRNVLSAAVDFATCESINMSKEVDREGARTLAAVTKVDKAPEGLLEKVTMDTVNVGLGYVCVRNRIPDDDSYEDARSKEEELFSTHPLLGKLSEVASVGVDALASRLMQLQAQSIRKAIPNIVKQVETALKTKRSELNSLTMGELESEQSDLSVFMKVVSDTEQTLEALFNNKDIPDIFVDEDSMHYAARLNGTFSRFLSSLSGVGKKIAQEEVKKLIGECRGLNLPNFVPHFVMGYLVKNIINEEMRPVCEKVVEESYRLGHKVSHEVMQYHMGNYPVLLSLYKNASIALLQESRVVTDAFVSRVIEKEMSDPFTLNPEYEEVVKGYREQKEGLMKEKIEDEINEKINYSTSRSAMNSKIRYLRIDGFPEVDLYSVLTGPSDASGEQSIADQSTVDTMVNLMAYRRVVMLRLADQISMEIKFALQKTMLGGVRNKVIEEIKKKTISFKVVAKETPALAYKKERLRQSVKVLASCKDELAHLMDPTVSLHIKF